MKKYIFLLLSGFIGFALHSCAKVGGGQSVDQKTIAELAHKYGKPSLEMFKEMLSIPNDAHHPDDLQRNLAWMDSAFAERKFKTTVLSSNGFPLLLAERSAANAKRTVLIYLQIDGQPVDSTKWFQESPYTPTLKANSEDGVWQTIPWEKSGGEIDPDWRIFARSASDAKGPAAAFLAALKAFDGEKFLQTYNIKVIMDFEEEQGSPNLPQAVERHRQALAADMLIIFDGPRHYTNRPTLTFGARGISTVTLTVYGPKFPQHSGHFGNYVPNPAFRLSKLLASMKDDDGRVTIPGYYDDVKLDDETRKILAEIPDDEAEIQRSIGISSTDKVGKTLQESVQYPSLNIRGMASAWVGNKVRTIVPATATAEIDVRLVPETDPERIVSLIRTHIENQGYYITAGPPTDEERMEHGKIVSFSARHSYGAFRTSYNEEVSLWLTAALKRAFGQEPIRKRMSGGSIPISPFINTLGVPAVTVPTVNSDNNQHSPNENIRVGNYFEGIRTFLAILTQEFE